MKSGNDLDLNTLGWVKGELDGTLNQARTALEVYVEDQADETQLQFVKNYLHQVRGTLQMVELYGAALAAEELEKLTDSLLEGKVGNRNDAYEVLMRGILQLPDYLEHLLAGHQDMPMVLLPLLNDLRAVRGEALLSENALFNPDLSVKAPGNDTITGENLSELTRKLRHNYHLGLLGWFRDRDSDASLKRIAEVIDTLRDSATEEEVNRLLWVAGGLVESLRQGGLDSNVSIKLLLGQLDRQFKKIIDNGVTALSHEPPSELLKNLLYYLANSQSDGQLTQQIKQAFRLREALPDTHTLERARADLSGPNAQLMGTVSAVLLEDLTRVKDNLDVFVRAEQRRVEDLKPLCETLKQMSDTLGMLGLGVQRNVLNEQLELLKAIFEGKREADDDTLMGIAAAMLSIENSLGEAAAARVANEDLAEGVTAIDSARRMQGVEQQKLLQTVIDQTKIELSRVKEVLSDYSKNRANHAVLEPVPRILDQIRGSISILNLERAADLLHRTNQFIRSEMLEHRRAPSEEGLDQLADAISSIEYYLESLAGKWGNPEAILDIAEQSLQGLLGDLAATPAAAKPDPGQPDLALPDTLDAGQADEDTLIDIPASEHTLELDLEDAPRVEELSFSLEDQTGIEPAAAPMHFELEESSTADLSLEDIATDVTLTDLSLGDINFETGLDSRGATDGSDSNALELSLGEDGGLDFEFGGLDETALDFTAADDNLFGEALILEGLNGDSDEQDLMFLQEAAEPEVVEPEPVERPVLHAPPAVESVIRKAAAPAVMEEIDDEIIEIFLEEAQEEHANISRLLPRWVANPVDEASLKDLRRSFHTLKGSGRLVGASDLGEFAWAFENMLNRVLEHTVQPSPEMFAILERGRQSLPELFELFKTAGKPPQAALTLMAQAEALGQGKSVVLEEPPAQEPPTRSEPPAAATAEAKLVEPPVQSNAPTPLPDLDPVLLDIYRKEVDTHLTTLRNYVEGWHARNEHSASNDLLRALHTLTGSSRTTGLQAVSELCSLLEKHVKDLQQYHQPVGDVVVARVTELIDYISKVVPLLDQPGATIPDNHHLLEAIQRLLDSFEAPESMQDLPQPEPPLAPITAEYDEELLDIFIEEGEEILAQSDTTLLQWFDTPDDVELIETLQRQLHTLKGGARMAGVSEIGDLGHSVESMLTAVVDGHLQVSPVMFSLLQKTQDRLVGMLEQVKAHQQPAAANDLIIRVDSVLGRHSLGHAVVADAPAPVAAPEPEIDVQLPEPESVLTLDDFPEAEQVDPPAAQSLSLDDPIEPLQQVDTERDLQALQTLEEEEDDGSRDRRKAPRIQMEQVRVRADLLDNLVNFAGEVSIYRSRMEQQTNAFRFNLKELDDTVSRLRDQLRKFEIEAETQIQFKQEERLGQAYDDFDPLEFDRFTQMQHLSRGMMESLSDLDSIKGILANITRESETLMLQQSRVNTELQEGLMRTRMVPFSGQAPRLRRIVRQTADETGRKVDLRLLGMDGELDRSVLERVVPPIEHMLRNAIAHGIEAPAQRRAQGKPETGSITLEFSREGSDIIIRISDDGAGINLKAIHRKAVERGLLKPDDKVTRDALLNMIMESGFSTAEQVTQIAGRGVGMDVVNTEIKLLGGLLEIDTREGKGTRFTISLPLTLAISRALMVQLDEDSYAVPLLNVQGVERISVAELRRLRNREKPVFRWVNEDFPLLYLGALLGGYAEPQMDDTDRVPVLLVRSGEYRAAIQVDALMGSREVVVKPVGAQLSSLRGISGATIMGDGSVVLILDLAVLVRLAAHQVDQDVIELTPEPVVKAQTKPVVMVVDDSITVRKVTGRLLERNNYQVMAAKDGVDALAQLQDRTPDIMLLDVEMPRMDGFELATNIRNDPKLRHIPIIMITSRTGQKHRERAMDIGVNEYLGKPYNDITLLEKISQLLVD